MLATHNKAIPLQYRLDRQHTGWALKVDGVIRRSSPSLIPLGAYVDAIMAGASEADADNIARAIEARPWPTYE